MKIEIKQTILAGMLERAILAMPPKGEKNPIQLDLGDEGITISCNDGDFFIITGTNVAEIDGKGIVFLPSFFKDIIRRAEGDTIVIEIDADNKMSLYDNLGFSSNIRVQSGTPVQPPQLAWNEAEKFGRESIIRSIESIKLAVSAESGQPSLMQAKIHSGLIVGTNSARYHEAPLDEKLKSLESTIPQQVIDPVLKILNMSEVAEIEFVQSDSEVGINIGNTQVIYNKLEYEYPEWVTKIPEAVKDNNLKFHVNRTDLIKKIEKVAITIDPASKNLTCIVKGNTLEVNAKDQFGNISKDIVVGNDEGANGRTFDVNYRYFLDALTTLKSVDVIIRLGRDKANKKSAVLLEDGYTKCVLVQTIVG